ncbi:MAG: SDR family oxidoreductase [Rhodospirillales bacterium]|nr:SDR family oxidoreductase [Rhodospirillales bacterium]
MTSTVLITGANRGIGFELARQYAADGWRVLACCRAPESAAALKGLDVEILPLDVADQASIAALKASLGDTPLDLLINNAGVGGGDHQSFGDIDYGAWEQTLITNTFGPYRMIEAFVDTVAASAGRTIANISSLMGSITHYDSGDEYIYRSSKTALNMVVHDLAIDLKDRGVTLLAFHPGWVSTDMGGPEAPVTPPDSARGIRGAIEKCGLDDTGAFLDHTGSPLPW